MREIKFRAWDKNESRMIYSGTEQNDYPFAWMIHNSGIDIAEHDGTEWNYLKELIFMQYTGLKDENGVEIYEGDILKFSYVDIDDETYKSFYDVIYKDDAFMVKSLECSQAEYEFLSSFLDVGENATVEVIGNIYENPELMEVEK